MKTIQYFFCGHWQRLPRRTYCPVCRSNGHRVKVAEHQIERLKYPPWPKLNPRHADVLGD